MRLFVLSLFILLAMAGPLAAGEKDVSDAPPQRQQQAEVENPYIKTINEKAGALAAKLTKEEAKALGMIRENFGYLHSIDIARKSVGDAVDQCADKNPDMKQDITARHKAWSEGIDTVFSEQEKRLKASISKDNFADPEPVDEYLDAISDMAKNAESKMEKTVVTTPEACKSLMGSMDDTQKVILGILTDMAWPGDKPAEDTAGKTDVDAENGGESAP